MKSYVCACWFALPDRLFFVVSWLLDCLLTGLLAGLLAGVLAGLLAGGLPLAVSLFLFRCLLYLSFGGFITRPFIWLFVAGVISFLVACCLFLGCVFFLGCLLFVAGFVSISSPFVGIGLLSLVFGLDRTN